MSRTLDQLVIDIEEILGCEHGEVVARKVFEEKELRFGINKQAIEDSMFNQEQISHIIESITPRLTFVSVHLLDEDVGSDEPEPVFTSLKCGEG